MADYIKRLEKLEAQVCKIEKNGTGGGGGGTVVPGSIGVTNTPVTLATLAPTDYEVYYVKSSDTLYKYSTTSGGTNIGQVNASGGGFWIPETNKAPGGTSLAIGHKSIPSPDGFFNNAMVKFITPSGSNIPIFAAGTDTAKVAGMALINIDYYNEAFAPEIWYRGNIAPGDHTSESSITNRTIITGDHTRQLGFGVVGMRTGNQSAFFTGGESPMRDDAILFWVSNGHIYHQMNEGLLAQRDTMLDFFVSGVGNIYHKGAKFSRTVEFNTNHTVLNSKVSTYVFNGTNPATLTLPVIGTADVWGASASMGMELEIINLGTVPLILSEAVILDASTSITSLNFAYPDNVIKIKLTSKGWIKVA